MLTSLLREQTTKQTKTNKMYYITRDRDNYSNKRVETAGVLCCELFRMLYKRVIKSNINQLEKRNRRRHGCYFKICFHYYRFAFFLFNRKLGVTQKTNYIRTGCGSNTIKIKFLLEHSLSYLRRFVMPMGKRR